MGCMKCGRDVDAKQVFCPECLETMRQYPVKKDAVVQIPNRASAAADRPAPVREPPAARTIRRQRGVIRFLILTVILLAGLLAATAAMLLHTLQTPDTQETLPHRDPVATTRNLT